MIKHHIDLTLTEEQTTAMEGWLDLLQESMSMLVSVSGAKSRRLFKMGAKSEAFVRNTLEAAAQHEALLPSGIREHMERDAALRERLRPLLHRLQQLLALVEGSYKLAGADLMKNSTAVYQILRLNGYGEGVESLLTELGTRFARPKRKKAPEAPAAPPTTESEPAERATSAVAPPSSRNHIGSPAPSPQLPLAPASAPRPIAQPMLRNPLGSNRSPGSLTAVQPQQTDAAREEERRA